MDTVINIRTDANVKAQFQKVADELGLGVSSLLNALMRQVIRTKRVELEVRPEIPNAYMIKMLKESAEDIKEGRVSPSFDNAEDAIAWLQNPRRKYVNQL
jgi:addiction module RelB/DinJ family antitoxin